VKRLVKASPVLIAVLAAVVYLVLAPRTTDLAAQFARAELFDRSGYVAYWAGWYGGMPTASYSLVSPPLLGWFGAIWLGALMIVATALVAVPLVRDSRRPVLAANAIVILAAADVASGRTTFAVGAVVALGAFLAMERRHTVLAAGLAVLATLASPVAGFLVLVVAGALIFVDRPHRRQAAGMVAGVAVALAVIAFLSRGSSGGGYEPFSRTSVLIAVLTALVVVIAPVSSRVRGVALVTIGVLLVLFLVHSPIGANGTRLAVLLAVPAIVASADRTSQRSPAGGRPAGRWWSAAVVGAIVLAAILPIAQLYNDMHNARYHGSSRQFSAGLKARLASDPLMIGHRLELADAYTHWPSTYLLPTVSLARGWERQTDEAQNPIFYGRGGSPLTPASYRSFLDRYAVGAVAVAQGVPLEYGSQAEADLIATGLPYLRPIWHDAHWQLYAVTSPTPLVAAPARVVRQSDTGLTVAVPGPGSYPTRLRWSPYLVVDDGSVRRASDGFATMVLRRGGQHRLHAVWRFP
jgi:hypothetical protein